MSMDRCGQQVQPLSLNSVSTAPSMHINSCMDDLQLHFPSLPPQVASCNSSIKNASPFEFFKHLDRTMQLLEVHALSSHDQLEVKQEGASQGQLWPEGVNLTTLCFGRPISRSSPSTGELMPYPGSATTDQQGSGFEPRSSRSRRLVVLQARMAHLRWTVIRTFAGYLVLGWTSTFNECHYSFS